MYAANTDEAVQDVAVIKAGTLLLDSILAVDLYVTSSTHTFISQTFSLVLE